VTDSVISDSVLGRMYGPRGWTMLAAAAVVMLVALPVFSLAVAQTSSFHLSAYWVTLIGKIMCYAIVAIAMDLIWGYTGILSLGHGLFFALGGYAFGMYLMREIGREGQYQADLPDFMVFLDWKQLPWQWWNSDQFWWCALLALAVPGLLAYVFGYLAFRSRVKGVYFSIITQALSFAAMLLFFRNDTGFGGNNGFTDFKRVLGFSVTSPETRISLFMITAAILLGTLVLALSSLRASAVSLPRFATLKRGWRSAATTRCTTSLRSGPFRPCSAASRARCTCRRSASSIPAKCRLRIRSRSPSGWQWAGEVRS
jgi:urea transport system permease protein